MGHFHTGERLNVKHGIDFSLIPLGVILIEFSALATQLTKDSYSNLANLLLLRGIHTFFMLVLSHLLARYFIAKKVVELKYVTIALTGTCAIALGALVHSLLGPILGVTLVSPERRIGIVLLQGCFWFPAFLILSSKRTEIFEQFRQYEQRLIISTRAKSRTSAEFAMIREEIHAKIKNQLSNLCNSVRDSVALAWNPDADISENNSEIQPLLAGGDLRKLSMDLETFGSEHQGSSFLGQNLNSVNLLITQYRILYSTTARNAPLRRSTYALVLIALVTPAYVNYFTFKETITAYPAMSLAILVASHFILKTIRSKSENWLRNSSIMIYLTGFLPIIANLIGQSITHDPNTKYPIFLTSIVLPASYYIFIKVLQTLNPFALKLIQNDELRASKALEETVTGIVTDEFSHTLSHRWAIFIHGKILTRLAATALKLETAASIRDTKTFTEAVDSLLVLLDNPDAEFEQDPTDLKSEVTSRLDPWIGLLEVDLHIDNELENIRNPRVRDLGEVIEELVSNSMRHGKAQEIQLWINKIGEKDIEIISKDNATVPPPDNQIRFGLGTRIFNLASDGRWSLTRITSSTEFRLTMAIEV
jgi:hypothetical protein